MLVVCGRREAGERSLEVGNQQRCRRGLRKKLARPWGDVLRMGRPSMQGACTCDRRRPVVVAPEPGVDWLEGTDGTTKAARSSAGANTSSPAFSCGAIHVG